MASRVRHILLVNYLSLLLLCVRCSLSSRARTPKYRGFDEFYGYYSGYIDYYSKTNHLGFLDLQDGTNLETDSSLLDASVHSVYVMQSIAESFIHSHAALLPSQPMFLYYAVQLIHSPFVAPSVYTDRCGTSNDENSKFQAYCGMNLMLDEVVANVTCVLESTGLIDNTIVILASDNGGSSAIPGSSVPFRGNKYDFTRGGVSANAYIFSKLLSDSVRGSSYSGLMHVTDWLPTLMSAVTEGAWTGSYSGATLDGVNQWDAIMSGSDESPRSLIVHYADYNDLTTGSIQKDNWKLDYNITLPAFDEPTSIVSEVAGGRAYTLCSNPSYMAVSYESRAETLFRDAFAAHSMSITSKFDEIASSVLSYTAQQGAFVSTVLSVAMLVVVGVVLVVRHAWQVMNRVCFRPISVDLIHFLHVQEKGVFRYQQIIDQV